MMAQFQAGQKAKLLGQPMTDCPWIGGPAKASWVAGWNAPPTKQTMEVAG